ncbi:hypothetical protein ZTR_02097 [Talaromyces verruculosus]|nr:hypothetical protein ZTR_02097 [Talaromyces verruculosus]
MSSTEKTFKVLIAGGSIAGLALAHMLEKFHLDYILLEAHSEIDPNIGASIGIGPHGARILDQLDLYEPIAELNYKDKRGDHIHKENGDCLLNVSRFHRHVEIRHGYPIVFIDRQLFLRVLYDRLQNKNCVLLNRKVDRVELLEGGVEVLTTDGRSVRGSLLIGADGVHSATRREMYRIGNEQAPEYFAADEQEPVSCHYICNFGIAQDVPGWKYGHTYTITGKGHSQLVVPGPENRIYWFFFEKLPETRYGKDVPRCTPEMEAEFIRKYEHAPITKTHTFGQLYAKRLFTTLTPLHEYVYDKWFFGRIFIMGDSAHKLNPISGHGGNAAIESAAEFVNTLLKKKYSRTGGLSGMTNKDIADIFTETQASRHERAKQIVFNAHLQQSFRWCEIEIPSRTETGTSFAVHRRVAFFTTEEAYELSHKSRTNDPAIQYHSFLSLSIHSDTENQVLLNFYCLSNLISPFLIYIIEGYRLGNRNTIIALPSLFLLAIQFKGIAIVSPIYATLSAFCSTPLPTRRFVKLEVARALLPALILGYILPMMLISLDAFNTAQWATWVSRVHGFAPVFVCGLTFAYAQFGQIWNARYKTQKDREQSAFECYKAQDVPALKSGYLFAFVLQTVAHMTLLVYVHNKLSITLSQAVFQSFWNSNRKGMGQTTILLSGEVEITFVTWFISNIYSIWDLRRFGYIKNRDGLVCASCVVAGQFLVGPGATWAGLWYWREEVIVGLQID